MRRVVIRISAANLKPKRSLDDIFADSDELLHVEPLKAKALCLDLSSNQFEEIVTFHKQHGRLPNLSAGNFEEKRLARRLNAFSNNPKYQKILSAMNIDGLRLSVAPVALENSVDKSELVQSLDDIFDDDDGLLEFDSPDIFTMKHVPIEKKAQPDERAQRQPYFDFPRFAPLFETAQHGLKNGAFSLVRFRHELHIQEGDFFTLHGVMGYVHKVGEALAEYTSYNVRWFNAPLSTVKAVIQYILDRMISKYRMDNTSGKIQSK